jgi:hypothetical protein
VRPCAVLGQVWGMTQLAQRSSDPRLRRRTAHGTAAAAAAAAAATTPFWVHNANIGKKWPVPEDKAGPDNPPPNSKDGGQHLRVFVGPHSE